MAVVVGVRVVMRREEKGTGQMIDVHGMSNKIPPPIRVANSCHRNDANFNHEWNNAFARP